MNKIKSKYLKRLIFSYISEEKTIKIIQYNKKIKDLLEINIYNYQKLFIQKHFMLNMVNLSKFKISNLIKFFNSK